MIIMRIGSSSCLITFCFVLLCVVPASTDDEAYSKSLLKFKESLTNASVLDDWNAPVANVCSPAWTGCVCIDGVVRGLRLEGMGLGGNIDIGSILNLPLYNLNVMNNNFSGPFPSDVNKLGNLIHLYLANNKFSGDIPDGAFSGMPRMRRVVLGNNGFTGTIPMSLLSLPKLVELQLQNNQFEGRIPDFWQHDLAVNFSHNKLEGPIPATLRNKNASSFSGNKNLCGKPLDKCKQSKLTLKIVLIIVVTVMVALAAIIVLFLVCRKKERPLKYQKSDSKSDPEEQNFSMSIKLKNSEHGKIYFVRNNAERFDLEELLRASAEVLGSGSFGSSYKTMLLSGQTYVVRRFRQMNAVGKEEFYEHMKRLGKLSHRNLLPLVAFYYGKEEKLLISDFAEKGSLAFHLHGKKGPNQPGLDWPTRLRIIKGVSRGLAYLYKELPMLTLPHGHLKSSNVLLDNTYEPLLADYALQPVISKDHAQQFMVAYKSPESSGNVRVTRKTDVWSLGILILELLTGKFPANYLKQGRGPSADLATWVNSVVREEWTSEVFDKDMKSERPGEGQMLKLLKIAMCCCEWDVEKRWDLTEAVETIEELKETAEMNDDTYSSYTSDVDKVTSDDFCFSKE